MESIIFLLMVVLGSVVSIFILAVVNPLLSNNKVLKAGLSKPKKTRSSYTRNNITYYN